MLANKPKTKILVDGGDPEDTSRVKKLLGFVDGQTTNPSLIAKNPDIQRRSASEHTLSPQLATVPAKILAEWATKGFPIPDQDFTYRAVNAKGQALAPIPYKELDLNSPWRRFDIMHELTNAGIQKFVADYRATLKRSA